MKRRRTLRGGVYACMILVLAACSSSGTVATGPDESPAVPTATPLVTTAPELAPPTATPTSPPVPAAEPSPTALVIPPAVATPEPATVAAPTDVPTVSPTSEAVPAATSPPASPPATVVPTSQPISGSQSVLAANGAEVYTLNCARCHAENGLGTAQYSASLIGVGSQYSSAGMIGELTNGHPVTFGFAGKLSDEEIASVVAYVKARFP